MKYLLTILSLLFYGLGFAASVDLEDNEGRTVKAELVDLEGDYLTFVREDGRRFTIPLNQLSGGSQDLVKEHFDERDRESKEGAADSYWLSFFPNGLVDGEGDEVSPQVLEGKFVCLYFSASWCGPCKTVTPRLKQLREQAGDHLEVVFVSQDRSEFEWLRYMRESGMEWLAVKWADYRVGDDNEVKKLISHYQAWGIPKIVVLSPRGELVDADARAKVEFLPEETIERLANYDYDGALNRLRERKANDGESLSAAEEDDYVEGLRARFDRKIKETERLLEPPADAGNPSDEPSWEEILFAFYAGQREAQ